MKFRFFRWILVLALLWGGGQGVYEAVMNPSPALVTCAAAQSQPPRGGWLQLSGCRVNLLQAAFKAKNGAPDGDIYLPLMASGDSGGRPRLVVATRDAEIVAIVKEMQSLGEKSDGAAFAYLAKNAARVFRGKDVRGMVQSGINKNDRIYGRLKELNKDLADDFVVIDEGREPALLWSTIMLAGGLGLTALFVLGTAKKRTAGVVPAASRAS